MEETLTLHKLGLAAEMGKSLGMTNCIESIMSQIGQYTDKVDYWQNSDQIHRWVGTSLLQIEPRIRKIREYKYLPFLRERIKLRIAEIQKNKTPISVARQKEPKDVEHAQQNTHPELCKIGV